MSRLEEINLKLFDTKNVTNMSFMFFKCTGLKELKFSLLFNTHKVSDMSNMFQNCSVLKN